MSADVQFPRPGWFTRNVTNLIVAGMARAGINIAGVCVLEVPGRSSGHLWRTPVNVLTVNGERYLIAPRGQTQWVRNLRASGRGRLLIGGRAESFTAAEVPDGERAPFLRAYLKRWKFAVGRFFDGVGPKSPPAEFHRIAHGHPVFRITPR